MKTDWVTPRFVNKLLLNRKIMYHFVISPNIFAVIFLSVYNEFNFFSPFQVEYLQQVIDGTNLLIKMEKRLQRGLDIDELLPYKL